MGVRISLEWGSKTDVGLFGEVFVSLALSCTNNDRVLDSLTGMLLVRGYSRVEGVLLYEICFRECYILF
jgi:hypothetical protein